MGTVSYQFDGETALVTGGSSGIGRRVALAFADAGAAVVVADVRTGPKDAGESTPTHERIRERGGRAAFVETDVSDSGDVAAAVEAARQFGGVDVMVNNAGVATGASLLESTVEDFERVQAVNTRGVLLGCQHAAADMLDRGVGGVVVNTASIRSTLAGRNQVQYCATKGAVRMVTRCAAFELADHGIRVNAVAPGPVATDTTPGRAARIREEVAAGEYTKPVPLGRAGEPDDVAAAVLFLASDASGYVTGELLHVDGGYQVY